MPTSYLLRHPTTTQLPQNYPRDAASLTNPPEHKVAGSTQKSYGALDTYAEENGRERARASAVYATTLEKVRRAYQAIVRGCDVLDLSPEGEERWRRSRQAYAAQIDRVEADISRVLTGRLSRCRSSAEMFRVFAAFNSLFYRARIRGAIQQFQARLVAQVSG